VQFASTDSSVALSSEVPPSRLDSARAARSTRSISGGPWLFGPRTDLALFWGSALVGLSIGALGNAFGLRELPGWGWLLLVLCVDVAHVHATWFRTYLDARELRRHPLRYAIVPLVAYALGWIAYHASPLVFWRVLAYVAVFHFVRQQAGWVALYRARDAQRGRFDRVGDDAAIYAATLYPIFEWHAHAAEKTFSWFVPGDFLALPVAAGLPVARAVWIGCLAAFFLREGARAMALGRASFGKCSVVATTALTWYIGIVPNPGDFVFTAANVIPHGVPYVFLLFAYTRERAREEGGFALGEVVAESLVSFALVLVGFAFFEQLAWDRWVDHERTWLFGEGSAVSERVLGWLVPLLALPQTAHYLLDGLLWRRGETRARPAQRAALGFVDREREGAQSLSPEGERA
jgi:hypothetical protein